MSQKSIKSDNSLVVRLPAFIGQEHEPKILIILRVFEEHVYYEERPLAVPSIALYVPASLLVNSSVSMIGWHASNNSENNQYSSVLFKEGSDYLRDDATGQQQMLPLDIRSMNEPAKRSRGLATRALTAIQTTSNFTEYYGWDGMNTKPSLKLILRPYKPLESSTINLDTSSSNTEVGLRGTRAIREQSSFTMTASPSVGSATPGIFIRITPSNSYGTSNWMFKIDRYAPKLDWFDLMTRIVVGIIILVFMYTILFGHRRLKPWGIVQRYLLRGSILRRLPSSARVALPPFSISAKKYLDTLTSIGANHSSLVVDARSELVPHRNRANSVTIAQQINSLEARMNTQILELARLQMLQHRTNAFYHRDDLFYLYEPTCRCAPIIEQSATYQSGTTHRESNTDSWVSGSVPLSTNSSRNCTSCYSAYSLATTNEFSS
ncbi:hypothetical protein BDF22DRAFT_742360 [Syncephalis plumigaleata]|nr:hypothetical protein BDF22DRAFT_742360 [Syncephalis plumigaleata]